MHLAAEVGSNNFAGENYLIKNTLKRLKSNTPMTVFAVVVAYKLSPFICYCCCFCSSFGALSKTCFACIEINVIRTKC